MTAHPRLRPAAKPTRPRATADVLACLLWVTVAAVLIDLGNLHHWHTADSLVPVLVSLYEWEPYYWEQNRYGMLVAGLARPFSNPLTNLLVQNGISIWFGLLCFPLAVRFLRGARIHPSRDRSTPGWVGVGLVAAGSFIAVAPPAFQFIFLSTFNVFSTSVALGLLGLIAIEKPTVRRYGLAAVAFGLAAWINSAIGVLLILLVTAVSLARKLTAPAGFDERGFLLRRLLPQAACCVGTTLFATFILHEIPHERFHNTRFEIPPLSGWLPRLREMAVTTIDENVPLSVWALFIGACLAASIVAAVRRPHVGTYRLALFGTLFLAMNAYAVAMGVLFDGRWRYATPAMVLVHVAAVIGAVSLLPPQSGRLVRVAACLLLAAVPLRHGAPSAADVAADLRVQLRIGYDEVVAADCTHVAGDYWKVWPAVFAANWHHYELRSGRTVWGLTHRSTPTERFWRAVPRDQVRVAAVADDPEQTLELGRFGPDWKPPERRGSLLLYVPR